MQPPPPIITGPAFKVGVVFDLALMTHSSPKLIAHEKASAGKIVDRTVGSSRCAASAGRRQGKRPQHGGLAGECAREDATDSVDLAVVGADEGLVRLVVHPGRRQRIRGGGGESHRPEAGSNGIRGGGASAVKRWGHGSRG